MKARKALESDPGAYEGVLAAEAEHASTPAGRREIQAELDAAASPVTRADLTEALRRGDDLRQRNQAVAASARGASPLRNGGQGAVRASDLSPGCEFLYRGVQTSVLRSPEPSTDKFGRSMMKVWARRADTGVEGYMEFGPDGVVEAVPLTADEQAKVFGPDFEYAVGTARANTPLMKSLTRQEFWSDHKIVLTPSGRLAVFDGQAWARPSQDPMLPWSPPEGRVVGSVSHRDGSVTRLA